MKKLTPRYKRWLLNRAYRQRRWESGRADRNRRRDKKLAPKCVKIYDGNTLRQAMVREQPIVPPSLMCFEKNQEDTASFLEGIRSGFAKALASENFNWVNETNGQSEISNYYDFSKIEEFSTSAALVFAAEYERAKIISCQQPFTVDLDKWPNKVFSRLYELGFFELLGITDYSGSRYSERQNYRTMKMVSGQNASELGAALKSIQALFDFLDLDNNDELVANKISLIGDIISEAITNVTRHAYPNEHNFEIRHVKKWWVTATALRKSNSLIISFYDQGATIPITFPKKMNSLISWIRDNVHELVNRERSFDFENDGDYIKTAMIKGHTQTNEGNRGLGLAQMKEVIDICKSGSISIYSRGGTVRYKSPSKLETCSSSEISVGGTLIEWRIDL